MENEEIARRFEFIAGVLESKEANPYRVQAYRNAAQTLRDLNRDVAEIAQREGEKGLREIPGIGQSLAASIVEFINTGRMSALTRIGGRTDPVSLISSLPGIGPEMAGRIHHYLGVETLEDLEVAAHEGELTRVPGFGRKRIRGVMDALAGRLGTSRRRVGATGIEPSVEQVLDVDREYREKAARNQLHKVAPRRFNPDGRAWLPILYTRRGNQFYTALYSNTARAHELGKTNDWVVLYYDTPQGSGQYTVVTSQSGRMRGLRVVRGRERECMEYYQRRKAA